MSTPSSLMTTGPMIVYDREGELWLRKKSWWGHTRWKKYYVVLCRLRRRLYLFSGYDVYERHLLELNGFDNDFANWTLSIPLQATSLYVTHNYFHKPCTFELCTPDGIYYLRTSSEPAMRGWLSSLNLSGVLLKSDEKPLLLWRAIDPLSNQAADCFYYCRALSSQPPSDRPARERGWNAETGIAKLVAKLTRKASLLPPATTATVVTTTNTPPAALSLPETPNSPADASPSPPPLSTSKQLSLPPGATLTTNSRSPADSSTSQQQLIPDMSFGKHGPLALLSRSIFANCYSDSLASADPSSPFFSARAAAEAESAAGLGTSTSKYSRWERCFYRTMENASGKPVLVRYESKDQTKHPRTEKQMIMVARAKIFDLGQLYHQAVLEVQTIEEREAQQQWKEAHADDEDDEAAEETAAITKKVSKKQRQLAFQQRVQSIFVESHYLPEPLPEYAPKEDGDFAVYLPVNGDKPAKYVFLRATTPREKKKWIQVLRNLAGDNEEDHTEEHELESLPLKDASAARKELTAKRPRTNSNSLNHQPPLPHLSRPPSSSAAITIATATNDPFDLDHLSADRLVHVSKRDFYSILGVSSDATTEQITTAYESMQRELVKRLTPMSPLHHLLPSPKQEEDETTAESAAMQPKLHALKHAFTFHLSKKHSLPNATVPESPMARHLADDFTVSLSSIGDHTSSHLPLTSHQIQGRLHRQLYELREIWRLLKDPVRRTQYDERRFLLRLDELVKQLPGLSGMKSHEQQAADDALFVKEQLGRRTSLSMDPSSNSTPTQAQVDLEILLARAETSAMRLPVTPARPVMPTPEPKSAGEEEEQKYPDLTIHVEEATPSTTVKTPPVKVEPSVIESKSKEEEKKVPIVSSTQPPLTIRLNSMDFDESARLKNGLSPTPPPPLNETARPNTPVKSLPDDSNHTSTDPPAMTNLDTPIKQPQLPPSDDVNTNTPALVTPQRSSSPNHLTLTPSPSNISETDMMTPTKLNTTHTTPLAILSPDATTKWMLGESVQILWNPRLTESELSPSAASHSPSKPDTTHSPRLVKLELMRKRKILRDLVQHLITADAENIGSYRFQLPLTLEPRSDYYIRLTLQVPPDAPKSVKVQLSRSPLFSLIPVVKPEAYVEGLERSISDTTGALATAATTATGTAASSPTPSPTLELGTLVTNVSNGSTTSTEPLESVTFHTDKESH